MTTYETILPLQILRRKLLPIQIRQRERAPNLRPSNPLAHLRDPLPLQPLLLNPEVNDHPRARQHEQQRRLPRERTRCVPRAQLAHRLCTKTSRGGREASLLRGGTSNSNSIWLRCCEGASGEQGGCSLSWEVSAGLDGGDAGPA